MKLFLILTGVLFLLVVVIIVNYFNRVGKPVHAELSDSYFYHKWKNKIIYSPMGNWFSLGYHELKADPASFTVLAPDFAKDAKTIFWKYKPLAADYASFRIDEQRIPRDKFHVYLDTYFHPPSIIQGADPESYHRLFENDHTVHHWGSDKNSIFLNGAKVKVDRESFQVLTNSFAADKHAIYQVISQQFQFDGTRGSAALQQKAVNDGSPIKILSEYYLQMGNTIMGLSAGEFVELKYDRIDSVEVIDDSTIKVNSVIVQNGNAQ